jgi:hypothetical protein
LRPVHPLQNTDNVINYNKVEAPWTFPERFTLTKKQLEPNLRYAMRALLGLQ